MPPIRLILMLLIALLASARGVNGSETPEAPTERRNIFARRPDAVDADVEMELGATVTQELESAVESGGFLVDADDSENYEDAVLAQRRDLKGTVRRRIPSLSDIVDRKKLALRVKKITKAAKQPEPKEKTQERNRACDDDFDMESFLLKLTMSMPPTSPPNQLPVNSAAEIPTAAPMVSLRFDTKRPTSAAPTKGPTRAPTTLAPVTVAPTSLEPSVSPSTAPLTRAPTTVAPRSAPPTKSPTSFPSTSPVVITSSPTQTTLCNPPLSISQRQSELLEILTTVSPEEVILTTGSSQNKAFLWLIEEDEAVVCPENELEVIQRYAMATNYFSLGGDDWRVCSRAHNDTKTSVAPCVQGERHLSGANVCDWFNVTCSNNDTNSVTRIILDNNNLTGTLAEELSSLVALETIGFNNNPNIAGSIPLSYGFIPSLKVLDLNASALTGSLPSELCSLTQLERFDLISNLVNGSLPSCLGQLVSLNTLALDKNLFTGALPSHVGAMTSLEYLTINDNELNGTIPAELGNNTAFKVISLQQNQLTGTIPSSLGQLTGLETFNVFSNNLVGSVPTELGNLFRMENLFLHFNALTGTMPEAICALRSDRGVGRIQQLTADCGPRGSIWCPRDCCTACF